MADNFLDFAQSSQITCFEKTYFFRCPLYLLFFSMLSTNTKALLSKGGDSEMVLCIPGITSSSLRRQMLGQVAAKVSPLRDCYIVTVQNRTCGSTPHTQNKYYISETKYKDMRSQPRLKEKQGKEVRTSKIIAEKHRYPRLDTVIQLHSEMDTETGWDTGHLPALSREAEHNCYGRKTNNQKAGDRDKHSGTQRIRYLTQPTISRSSSINRERLLFNTHSKPKKLSLIHISEPTRPY